MTGSGSRRGVAAAALGVTALGAASGAQPSPTVVVRVVDAPTRRPLANADVVDFATGASRLTDERGQVRVAAAPGAALRLRVRQIGYQPFERRVERGAPAAGGASGSDTLTVALERVAFRLPGVVATADVACPARDTAGLTQGDTTAAALTTGVLLQIRTAAERYDSFRRAYPFRVRVERRTAEVLRDGTAPRIAVARESGESDRYAQPYRPGSLIRRERGGFSVPVLFVTALADADFLARHCFAVRGVESLGTARVLRMTFAPARGVSEPEWDGAVLVDAATSYLRRVEFRLANLSPRDQPARLEGYVTFTSPSPYVVLPESTFAEWWRLPAQGREGHAWGPPDVVQLLRLDRVEYHKERPPALKDSTPERPRAPR